MKTSLQFFFKRITDSVHVLLENDFRGSVVQPAVTCSKSTMETQEQYAKSVQR